MKLAVLADIHGNYRALETVIDHIQTWHPDQVLVAGDIVNRGPPAEVILLGALNSSRPGCLIS